MSENVDEPTPGTPNTQESEAQDNDTTPPEDQTPAEQAAAQLYDATDGTLPTEATTGQEHPVGPASAEPAQNPPTAEHNDQ